MTSNDHDHNACRALFAKLSEYLDGELDADQHKEIEHHAQACLKCNSCLETLRRTVALCHSLKPEPVPKDFTQALSEIIQKYK